MIYPKSIMYMGENICDSHCSDGSTGRRILPKVPLPTMRSRVERLEEYRRQPCINMSAARIVPNRGESENTTHTQSTDVAEASITGITYNNFV